MVTPSATHLWHQLSARRRWCQMASNLPQKFQPWTTTSSSWRVSSCGESLPIFPWLPAWILPIVPEPMRLSVLVPQNCKQLPSSKSLLFPELWSCSTKTVPETLCSRLCWEIARLDTLCPCIVGPWPGTWLLSSPRPHHNPLPTGQSVPLGWSYFLFPWPTWPSQSSGLLGPKL